MIVVYVNDCGIAAKKSNDIHKLIDKLRKLDLTYNEGDFTEYLGMKIEPTADGKGVHMTQSGLIDKILKATNMEDCNPNHVPASQVALGSDPDGPLMTLNNGVTV